MTNVRELTMLTIDIPTPEYSHHQAAQIFEDILGQLQGNNAMHDGQDDNILWEGSFYLPVGFDMEEYEQMKDMYQSRYPGIDWLLAPEPATQS